MMRSALALRSVSLRIVLVPTPPAATLSPLKGIFQQSFSHTRAQERGCAYRVDATNNKRPTQLINLRLGVPEVANCDSTVIEMMDRSRIATIDADEGHPSKDSTAPEGVGEHFFDPQAVHEGQDPGLGANSWGHKLGGIVEGSRL